MPRILPTTTRGTLLSLGLIVLMSALLSAALVGCGGGGADTAAPTAAAEALRPPPPPAPPPPAPLTNLASVGDKLFHDRNLSASGRLACASCHATDRAHADPAGSFLPLGGANLDKQGLRSSPSLRYLDLVGPFRIDAQGNAQGGLFWDGRADNRVAQARGPLFNASEMANESVASLVTKLRATPYFNDLLRAAALPASAGDEQLLQASLRALADYQAQDAEFHAYTAKFDAVQDGRAQFTAQEARGLAVFNDPQRGNCAQCHSSRPAPNAGLGARAQFSDHRHFALGVPRNQSQATADPAFFDLGLCGPQRSDLVTQADQCGKFRVPTLRNVALTGPYFHNASLVTLEEVVAFYATRDSDPARWYPVVNGQVQRFNDLPAAYRANLFQGAPFNRRPNQAPAMTPQDVSDVVAFLRTLSDGFNPAVTR